MGINAQTWTTAYWVSQALDWDLCKQSSPSWGLVTWNEDGTEDEDLGYVRIDVLDSSDNVLVNNLSRDSNIGGINLADYDSLVNTKDIKIKVKGTWLSSPPVVRNLRVQFQ